jgi:hypothetical protein
MVRLVENSKEEPVPYQVYLTRKDKTVRADLRLHPGKIPTIGDAIDLYVDGTPIMAGVREVRSQPAKGAFSENVDHVDCEEI